MKRPANFESNWLHILQTNLRFLFGAVSIGLGWLLWTNASAEWWGFWIIGLCLLLGGGMELLSAAKKAFEILRNGSRLRRFERSGRAQKADPIASDQDMIDAGRSR